MSISCTDCVPMMWNACKRTLAAFWSVPTPYTVNLRPFGTVKIVARGESLLALTVVTLFCAMRSGLSGIGRNSGKGHLRRLAWIYVHQAPNVNVRGVELSGADNGGQHLQSELIVPVKRQVRERIVKGRPLVRVARNSLAQTRVIRAGAWRGPKERNANIVTVKDGLRRRR